MRVEDSDVFGCISFMRLIFLVYKIMVVPCSCIQPTNHFDKSVTYYTYTVYYVRMHVAEPLLNPSVGETGVGLDTFHFFSNIAETIYDRDL